jgi:hypothetical protein
LSLPRIRQQKYGKGDEGQKGARRRHEDGGERAGGSSRKEGGAIKKFRNPAGYIGAKKGNGREGKGKGKRGE